jgi:hypothetical protein
MQDSASFTSPRRRPSLSRALSPVRLAALSRRPTARLAVAAGTVVVTVLALFTPAAQALTGQNPIGYLDTTVVRRGHLRRRLDRRSGCAAGDAAGSDLRQRRVRRRGDRRRLPA